MRPQMLYTNGSFEICQERMFVKQRWTHSWSTYLLLKKIFMLKQKSSNLCMMVFNSVRKFFEWLFIHITLETAPNEMQCDETISHMVIAGRSYSALCETRAWLRNAYRQNITWLLWNALLTTPYVSKHYKYMFLVARDVYEMFVL